MRRDLLGQSAEVHHKNLFLNHKFRVKVLIRLDAELLG